ncbi:zinc finger protein 628 [Aricia agestis]|uniref:zinc finger protein 628 n=1 Tax=Aricia agestis TaxID=91739 RepID=UPI001C208193|nr:zinc finger protein 628 [Aricia agestis]
MEGEDFKLQWEEDEKPNMVVTEEVICGLETVQNVSYTNMTAEELMAHPHQTAAENLMYLSQDVVYTDNAHLVEDPSVECVTEEVITDDWVLTGGQDRVEVPLEQLTNPVSDVKIENDIDVPLPTDQDEYTAMRPWPCDFCSRRFRKKAALMNHMVAHQSDRPHACNLCGVRYVRKPDLMAHLKVHAYQPDNMTFAEDAVIDNSLLKPRKKRGRRKKAPQPPPEDDSWENMTSARTQQWSRRARTPPKPPPQPSPSPSPPPPLPSPSPPPADPARPFVCRQCGVGFAREKALQSHSRIHGGDSPIECSVCGELCWSRDALRSHTRARHPDMPARTDPPPQDFGDTDSDDDIEYQMSPVAAAESRDNVRGPELFCGECGVAFQRADLLRRHVAAAHSYKRQQHDSSGTWEQHTCEVCGEACGDALTLLAHAERHAERPRAANRLKKMSRGRHATTTASGVRQFPCKECGKVFGSRSSQQIHVRIHTGERPYACRFCWKAFADGGTLRKHERIHTGEKPYACAVCPRAFNQRVVLREHVRSHHSAPDRRAYGGYQYCCSVCGKAMNTSQELVQHLIQHCDENTAMKRQPQNGPRKYKRRRKLKTDESPPPARWRAQSESPAPSPLRPPSPSPPPSPIPSPSPPPRRRRRRRVPPPRPRMIHTEEPRPRTKQVRGRRPPRHPADDLLAIGPHSPSPPPAASPLSSPVRVKTQQSPSPVRVKSPLPSPSPSPTLEGPFKCEMCSEVFPRRDALLLHVPVHI